MLKLTLSEFIHGQYVDDYEALIYDSDRIGRCEDPPCYDIGVYVVKNGETLYVGMSKASIWNRWFASGYPHMVVYHNGAIAAGTSKIGRVICDHLPASLDWTIELWSEEDCLELFADDIARKGWKTDRVRIADFEHMMIRRLQPTLNVLS